MLRSVTAAAKRLVLFGFGVMSCALLFYGSLMVYAADTQVEVTLCSEISSNASMTVNSPQSDSVVDQLPLVVSGTVRNITQIDITIDGQYDSTVPVAAQQTSFSTSLQLSQGTHTITLEGNDLCQLENPTASLVVTYHPKAVPGRGSATPTTTPGAPTDTFHSAAGNGETIPNTESGVPFVGSITPVMQSIARALDLDISVQRDGLLKAMSRFALFTTGVGLVLYGPMVVRLIHKLTLRNQAVESYIHGTAPQDPKLSEHIHRNITVARLLGVLLIGVSFVI